jgi:hypothetical protein
MAQTYHCRPSDLVGPLHPLTAFYLDRAIFAFGQEIEADLEAAGKKAKNEKGASVKQQMVLNRWLRTEGGGRFKDPAARR